MKPARRNPIEVQKSAVAFVREYISSRPLGLPDMEEATFTAVMDAIVKAMVQAWGDGYYCDRGPR